MNETRSEIILAAGFLTRLRLPTVEYSDETMARATRWYALVGLVIGLALAALFWALATILPQVLAALMTIAAAMLLTGALHEDGLADIAARVEAETLEPQPVSGRQEYLENLVNRYL